MSDTLNEGGGIPPALSAAEWALIDERNYRRLVAVKDPRALAALALQIAGPDGRPLFTWEDVKLLRAFADGNEQTMPFRAEADARALADRLAILLPPEEP